MSGTRKMEKFELDAYTKAREQELAGKKAALPEPDAPGAIAPPKPGARSGALDAGADLPARAFEPRASAASGVADLPASPFERRPASGGAGPADLPALPFEPRAASGGPGAADLPALPFDPRGASGAASSSGAVTDGTEPPSTSGGSWIPGEWIPPQKSDDEPSPEGARGSNPGEQDPDALRTRLARKFVTLADSVTDAFRDFAIGAGAYAVELTAPQGMSTGGGKQALQHIRLRPRREGYSVLVAGTVNQIERRAELRDYDHITIMSEVRFRHGLDISRQEWEQLLRKAEVVLNGAGIQSMRTPPPRELLEQRRGMQRVSRNAIVALLVVLVLAAAVLWRVAVALRSGG